MKLNINTKILTIKFCVSLLCALLVNTNDVLSQKLDSISYDLSLEELLNIKISTATKTVVRIEEVPAVTEVITREQIMQRGYQNLAQVLNDIADNHEDRSNWGIGEPLNQNVGLGFRFDTGQNILLLFNGQRLNAFLPGNRFGGEEYLLNTLERIEIIRGPGSALYGSNAFTSVVNIISRTTIDKQSGNVQMGSEYIPTSNGFASTGLINSSFGKGAIFSGSFRYFSETGQTLTVNNSLFGNSSLKDGVKKAIDAEFVIRNKGFNIYSKIDNQQRKTFTGFNAVNPSGMDKLTLSMYAYSLGADKTFKFSKKTNLKISAGWHQDNWTEVALIPQFKINAQGDKLILDNNGQPVLDTINIYRDGQNISTSFFIDGQGADTRSFDGEVQLTVNYAKSNNIVFGIYASDDRILRAYRPTELNISPLGFVPFRTIDDPSNNWLFDTNASRQVVASYSQADYNILKNLIISAGARLDHYSGTGVLKAQQYTEFNPRGGIVYLHRQYGAFKLLYGKATRVPNGFETLSSVAILGNPQNTAERIQTSQFLWLKRFTSFFNIEFGAFRSVISNRLQTDASISDAMLAQGYVGQFRNFGNNVTQSNNGIDGKLTYRLNKVDLLINFTKFFGSDDGTGKAIAYIPSTMVNGDVNVPIGYVNLNFGFNYRDQFSKAANDPREPVKGYFIARSNITVNPPTIPFSFYITGRNIFNSKFQYPSSSQGFVNHFPARGIEIVIGVRYILDK